MPSFFKKLSKLTCLCIKWIPKIIVQFCYSGQFLYVVCCKEWQWKLKKLGQPFQVLMLRLQKSPKSYMVIVQIFAPDVILSVNARLAIRKRVDLLEATLPQRKSRHWPLNRRLMLLPSDYPLKANNITLRLISPFYFNNNKNIFYLNTVGFKANIAYGALLGPCKNVNKIK